VVRSDVGQYQGDVVFDGQRPYRAVGCHLALPLHIVGLVVRSDVGPYQDDAVFDGGHEVRGGDVDNQLAAYTRPHRAVSGAAGPLAARSGGQICRPFVLGFWKLESLFKV